MSAVLSPGRFDARNVSVKNLVQTAYGVEFQRIVGGPDWVDSARFDIAAVFDSDPGSEPEIAGRTGRPSASPVDRRRFRPMLQRLLTERFRLRVSTGLRELPHHALMVSRPETFNARVRPSAVDCDAQYEQRRREGLRREEPTGRTVGSNSLSGATSLPYVPMRQRCPSSRGTCTPTLDVLSKTRPRSTGDFRSRSHSRIVRNGGSPERTSLRLVARRLSVDCRCSRPWRSSWGLHWSRARGRVEVLVIEHVERPTPN